MPFFATCLNQVVETFLNGAATRVDA